MATVWGADDIHRRIALFQSSGGQITRNTARVELGFRHWRKHPCTWWTG